MPPDQSQIIISDGAFPVDPGADVTFTVESLSRRHFRPFRLEIAGPDAAPAVVGRFKNPDWTIAPPAGWLITSLRFGIWEQLVGTAREPLAVPAEVFGPGALDGLQLPIVNPGQLVTLLMRNTSRERRSIKARLLGRELSQ